MKDLIEFVAAWIFLMLLWEIQIEERWISPNKRRRNFENFQKKIDDFRREIQKEEKK